MDGIRCSYNREFKISIVSELECGKFIGQIAPVPWLKSVSRAGVTDSKAKKRNKSHRYRLSKTLEAGVGMGVVSVGAVGIGIIGIRKLVAFWPMVEFRLSLNAWAS